ncbi:MAG: 3-hydroxyacyl-ACP dehydratase FabZ [Oscillospiraceae bacterium]
MDQAAIQNVLPHRPPMLLVQEAEMNADGSAVGKYAVSGEEWFLKGHFPQNPVVPGVILCEILAQTCCVLLAESALPAGKTPYFTGLDKVKFRRPVKPGDVVETHCKITRSKAPFYFAEGTCSVGGQTAMQAQFSFALVDAT